MKKPKKDQAIVKRSVAWYMDGSGRAYLGSTFDIEHHYWKFYQEGKNAKGSVVHQLEGALKSIVWGALYLEAVLNFACERAIDGLPSKPHHVVPVWDMVRPLKWAQKFSLIGALAKRPKAVMKKMHGRFHQVMELRNRLVHFKERPTRVNQRKLQNKSGKLSVQDRLLAMFPATRLELEIFKEAMPRFHRNVALLRNWIELTLPSVLTGTKVRRREAAVWHETPEQRV